MESTGIALEPMLILISATIIGLLGAAHLILTFNGPKLQPRDPQVRPLMERVHPGVTRQTAMWRAWLGFNAREVLINSNEALPSPTGPAEQPALFVTPSRQAVSMVSKESLDCALLCRPESY